MRTRVRSSKRSGVQESHKKAKTLSAEEFDKSLKANDRLLQTRSKARDARPSTLDLHRVRFSDDLVGCPSCGEKHTTEEVAAGFQQDELNPFTCCKKCGRLFTVLGEVTIELATGETFSEQYQWLCPAQTKAALHRLAKEEEMTLEEAIEFAAERRASLYWNLYRYATQGRPPIDFMISFMQEDKANE